MFDGNQLVKTKWTHLNKHNLEGKGYKFTKYNAPVFIKASDLNPKSIIKIKAICDYCGEEYYTSFCSVGNGKDACIKCAPQKANEVRRKRMAKETIKLAKEICETNGYTLVSKEEDYSRQKDMIKFICPKHGLQEMATINFLHGHKCIKCSYKKRADQLRNSIDDVKNIIEKIDGNKLLNPEEYIDCITKNLRIKCKCGREYTASLTNYMRHDQTRCPFCSNKESVFERKIREYLEELSVSFEQEKRFPDCKDKKPLPFDFYLQDFNLCIEFDGLHHYKELKGRNQLDAVKRHDKIKNDYCKKHGISILRISCFDNKMYKEQIYDAINNR